ncbi:conjugal transfer protein TraG N-terminal domain-containing protein [Stenotrophomonas maltophilia]|uniref:conjugal transfer protein TraG N-terminal domain-containing protein n=1 Tax=Stenotrophomonas maltophilia TaxID=40324 RepID=UPI0021C5A3F3|nr:conjugal transfer protein TraG N-terminal domain-containing protein [Stenotrophomonas maltophilia]MCU1137019.1 conjugal transfer protein TraG N-terminal domain-containing protein [Stenotrophomonas maltophilia]
MNFEILVLGDGAYTFAVLNAVASIKSYGVLGSIGGMIGLLLMWSQGMMSGGQKFEAQWILVSIVVFWILFIPRVDKVMITEVMTQPGKSGPRSFVVDNVPLGLAGIGYFTSNVTSKLTGLMETSFGSATDETRGTTGGLGQNLMLMASMRNLLGSRNFTDASSDPSRPGYLEAYRENAANFLSNCVYPLVNNGVVSKASVMNSPGLSGYLNDAFANDVAQTRWNNNGAKTNVSCKTARDSLQDQANDRLLTAFDAAAKATGSSADSAKIQSAFGGFTNQAAEQMQTMMAVSVFNSVAAEAAVRGGLSAAETQSIIMVEEAAARRNVQWAGEENLFIRILRPIVGFFESLFYALAPIMALVCTMGPFGWKMIGKYLMLTIWVGLWFPMLAITQLYSNVTMQNFFDLLNVPTGQSFSPEQLNMIANQSMDALGAASALTAATPALAMSLLFGGAVSMSYLAGRLQGSDMIDETKVAPQASSVAPIAQMGSGAMGSVGGGTVTNGRTAQSITMGDMRTAGESVSAQAVEQASLKFSETLGHAVKSGAMTSETATNMVSAGWTENQTKAIETAIQSEVARGNLSQEDIKAFNAMSQHSDVGMDGAIGLQLAGTGVKGTTSSGSSSQDGEQRSSSSASSFATRLGQNDAVRNAASKAVAEATQDALQKGFQTSMSEEATRSLSKSADEVVTTQEAYARTEQLSRSLSSNESMTMGDAARRFETTHGGNAGQEWGRLETAMNDAGLGQEYRERLDAEMSRGAYAGDPTAARFAAMYNTLSQAHVTSENAAEVQGAMNSLLGATSTSGGYTAGTGVDGRVVGGREIHERASAQTEAAAESAGNAAGLQGPNIAPGSVFGQAAAGTAAVSSAVEAGGVEIPQHASDLRDEQMDRAAADGARLVEAADVGGKNAVGKVAGDMIGNEARFATGGMEMSGGGDTYSPIAGSAQFVDNVQRIREGSRKKDDGE